MLSEAIVSSPTLKAGKISSDDQKNFELVPGTYQLQIHIIECIDIELPEFSSLNPIVTYDLCGKYKGHTNAMKNRTKSPIFDYYKYVSIDITEELLESTVAITFFLKDSSAVLKNNTIGSFQIDLQAIYSSNFHEIYRTYFPLINLTKDKFVGKLLASLILLGKEDKPVMHDRASEIKNEKKEFNAIPKLYTNISDSIAVRYKKLVVELLYVERIPVCLDKSKIKSFDLVVSINYFHDKVVATNPITVEASTTDKNYNTLYFMTKFNLPFKEPSIHSDFSLSIWERQGLLKYDKLLGSTTKLRLDKNDNKLIYLNLYGSLVPDNMCLDLNEKNKMNRNPNIASSYLGRALLKFYIIDNDENYDIKVASSPLKSPVIEENEVSFITNGRNIPHNIYSVRKCLLPANQQYSIKVKAHMGQSLPLSSNFLNSAVPKFAIKFCLLDYELVTEEQTVKNGTIFWNNNTHSNNNSINVTLPEDIDYIPDLFVYLLRDSIPICYYRFKITDLLQMTSFEPTWYELHTDRVVAEEPTGYFNCSILLSISFKAHGSIDTLQSRNIEIGKSETTISPYRLIIDVFQCKNLRSMDNFGLSDPYISFKIGNKMIKTTIKSKTNGLIVDVFQCKNLRSMDNFGLSDPYISFKIGNKMIKTTIKSKTNDPIYFETLVLDMVDIPDDSFYFPYLLIECLDSDYVGNDVIGFLKYSLKDHALINDNSTDNSLPKWFDLSLKSYHRHQIEIDKISAGSILIRVKLIKLSLKNKIYTPLSITPALKLFRMEMLVYGIRHLKSVNSLVPLMMPYLVLKSNETKIAELEPMRLLCSPKNPNYCARITIGMKLPIDSIFAPSLYISVYDKRLGSITDSHVGLASIDLNSYYPNSSHHDFRKISNGNPYHLDYLPTTSIQANTNYINSFKNANNLPSYLINRTFLAASLEETLGFAPFQIYNIVTGKTEGSLLDTKYQHIGTIKGLLHLVDIDDVGNSSSDISQIEMMYKSLSLREKVVIRVYILQAKNLLGADDNNKADPFLNVSLGGKTYNTRDRYHKKTLNPSFYTSFEFKHTFPDCCELRIKVMDRDNYNFDDLLGSTVIDLEDRYYNYKWRKLNINNNKQPVETRFLWNPNYSIPNGTLSLWVDILSEDEARKSHMLDITRLSEEWELRIVIWKACDFKAGDPMTGMNDLQVRCSILDNVQSTDIHYLLDEDEEGSFNWRMKFPIKLPIETEEEGSTRLNIQVWDYDILFSDLLDEMNIDLSEELEKCYSRYVKVKERNAAPYFVWSFFSEKDEEEKARKRYIHELEDIESGAVKSEKIPLIKKQKKKKISLFKRFTNVIFNDDIEPENSKWINFPDNGKVLMSIEILPKKVADIMKNGLGRNEPNNFPELPGPTGRVDFMKMAYNPFYFFRSILGKKNCFRFQIFLIFILVGILYKFVIEPFLGFFEMIFKFCYKIINPTYIIIQFFLVKHYDEVKQLDNRTQMALGLIFITIIIVICYCFYRFIIRKCKCLKCCRWKKKKRNFYNETRPNRAL